MGGVALVFYAELRRRWRSWLAIAVLISVVGGFVLAAAAAGRRTESAFPRFVSAYGFDAAVFAIRPVPKVAGLTGVTSVTAEVGPFEGQPTCACTHVINPTDLEVGVVSPGARPVWKLVSGRLPDPSDPNQVLASFTLQQDDGVHIGTVIHVPFYAASQLAAATGATGAPPRPLGPTVAFHVVGIEAAVGEFPSGSSPVYDLFASRAFARTVVPRTANGYEYFVRPQDGAAGLARVDAEANALHTAGVEGYENGSEQVAFVEASIRPQAIGWWIMAALAAVVGLAVIGQAMARQSVVESGDYPTLAALGADRRWWSPLASGRPCGPHVPCGPATRRKRTVPRPWRLTSPRWAHRLAR